VKSKYALLLTTRCGCTRLVETYSYPPPYWTVPLETRFSTNQVNMFELGNVLEYQVAPHRKFERREIVSDTHNLIIIRYAEVE
jgi:hypothetical protein